MRGKKKYFVFNEPALNTFDEVLAKEREEIANYKIVDIREVEIFPLKEILDMYLPKDQTIDFINIDVEGLDFEVIQSNDWNKYRPQVVIVEIIPAQCIEDLLEHETTKYLKAFGYSIFAKTFNSVIFSLGASQ